MKKIVILAFLLGVGSLAPPVDLDEAEFLNFLAKHNKEHKNKEEYGKRLGIFKKNLKHIKDWNDKEATGKGWKKGITKFADWTDEEYQQILGAKPENDTSKVVGTQSLHLRSGRLLQTPPSSLDWRTRGIITPIKDQGQCGSCWAFSTVAAAESQKSLRYGYYYDISEQHLTDCTYPRNGCWGGWFDAAAEFFRSRGLQNERDYPYTGVSGFCASNSQDRHYIQGGSFIQNDVNFIKNYLNQNGPVQVCVNGDDWKYYSGGIFFYSRAYYCNHNVLLIGYGNEWGRDYWILKNSWSTYWGEQGFIRADIDYGGVMTQYTYALYI